MKRMIHVLFLLLLTIAAVGVAAQEAMVEPGMYTNPVLNRDFPDPDVILVDGVYYAYATNSGETNIQVARSTDLVNWEWLGDVLPQLPTWARQDFGWAWAPEVFRVDDHYLMYFVARARIGTDGMQCIGIARSDKPEGPFEPVGDEPFICQTDEGGSIDATTFIDDDGTNYILWKNDGNSTGGQSWIYIQRLSPDGLTLEGERTRLITADIAWEGKLVEAPTLWKHEGRYYLFYSANTYYDRNYAVGYAVSDNFLGPYDKPAIAPVLKTLVLEGTVGPGGQDIVLDAQGNTWMLYHSWIESEYRAMSLVCLEWRDGVPVMNPTREPMVSPF